MPNYSIHGVFSIMMCQKLILFLSFNRRFWVWVVEWLNRTYETLRKLASSIYTQPKPQRAEFLAWLFDGRVPSCSVLGLFLCCCPWHLREQEKKNISASNYIVRLQGEGNSQQPLCTGEKIFVNLISLSPVPGSLSEDEIKNYHLE